MKKFGKYFTLTILLLLGLCCIGILYLFFIPGSSLFTITYISYNNYFYSEKYEAENINHVMLSSNNYEVNVVSSSDNQLQVKVYSSSLGFVLQQNKAVSIVESVNNGIVKFEIKEPYGATFAGSSYIELVLPANKALDVSLKNNKADTTIFGTDIQINNLSYTTTSGDCQFSNGTISGSMNLNLQKADFKIGNSVETNNNNLTLNLTTGKFDASTAVLGDIQIKSNTRGVVKINECAALREDVSSSGGRIEVTKASHINVKSSDINIYANEVTDGAIIELTKSGDVEIKTLSGVSDIKTNDGHISLNVVNSNLMVESNYGNITINNAMLLIDAKTNYGTIFINYSSEALTNAENPDARALFSELKNGKLIVKGIEKIDVNVTGNARVEVDMKNVCSDSKIKGKDGSVFVKINKDSVYQLVTSSAKGSVRVNLTQIDKYNGYTTKQETLTYVNCLENTFNNEDYLTVSTTSGSLTILDTNFA